MRFRDRLCITAVPIVLRLLLGVSFIWIGLGKVFDMYPVTGVDAAILANLGVIETGPPVEGGKLYSGADFDSEVRVRRLHEITLTVHHAAEPAADEAGVRARAIWPRSLAGGQSPVVLAWSVALGELFAGLFLLIGMLTRVWSVVLFVILLTALWLTEFGPAVQSGHAVLGILPNRPFLVLGEWRHFLWLGALTLGSLALALAGPGGAAIDRALFKHKGDDA